MNYKKSTIKVFKFVNKVKERKRKNPSSTIQTVPLDEQTKNDFELRHDIKLKDTMIYLDPDNYFMNNNFLLAYVIKNEIHIKKSKYNPGSNETQELLEHELTHVMQHSENRDNEPVDELELEAKLSEEKHLRDGECLHWIEYLPEKYCKITETEYKHFLNKVADYFEYAIENMLFGMSDEERLRFLIKLQYWAEA